MKGVPIILISLAALSTMAPRANAQQTLQQSFLWMYNHQRNEGQNLTTRATLVQKFQTGTNAYPGVTADILGIRIGMKVSQAEAAAEKSYQDKPQEKTFADILIYKDVRVRSYPFVQAATFATQSAHMSDTLSLTFSSPVSGNTLYGMTRVIDFGPAYHEREAASYAPKISTLEASLIKKYGPPSARNVQPNLGFYLFYWAFSAQSRVDCKYGECMDTNGPEYTLVPDYVVNDVESAFALDRACGALQGYPNLLRLFAYISPNGIDRTKARNMHIAIWDSHLCKNDRTGLENQLHAAAIKFYKTVSKTPAGPKF